MYVIETNIACWWLGIVMLKSKERRSGKNSTIINNTRKTTWRKRKYGFSGDKDASLSSILSFSSKKYDTAPLLIPLHFLSCPLSRQLLTFPLFFHFIFFPSNKCTRTKQNCLLTITENKQIKSFATCKPKTVRYICIMTVAFELYLIASSFHCWCIPVSMSSISSSSTGRFTYLQHSKSLKNEFPLMC